MTVAHVYTVAFQGIEAREVDVQVHIADCGGGQFNIVGLADKAVAESRERVRAALAAIGLALPFKRITVNLAPADLPKEGSHYDLPIALGLLAAMGVLPASEMANYVALGELSLDAAVTPVAGVLPAALAAVEAESRPDLPGRQRRRKRPWPAASRSLATPSLIALVNHIKGASVLTPPVPRLADDDARRARPARRQGPGKRQARAGDRRRRRPQPADDRPARRGQVDAGAAPARPAAAAGCARGAGDFHDPVAGGRAGGRRHLAARGRSAIRIIPPRWRRWWAAA